MDPEFVHESITSIGAFLGKSKAIKSILKQNFTFKNALLSQKYCDITFPNPVGLSAGFDYEASLMDITPSLGFGFHTVGTISYHLYNGNPKPRLGRLPKSKALLVNKGFKNLGSFATARKMKNRSFAIPIGISIGRTNNSELTQEESVEDIIGCFKVFEKYHVKNSYYELNISCPNLKGSVTFYTKKNLENLLTAVDKLHLKKPLFVKMPISEGNEDFLTMLEVVAKHSPKGIIIGNLQKDRKHPSLKQSEVKKFPSGNFSGKPTYERSNELIALTYKLYKDRFIIIGCGGIFSAKDAYEKIALGASLVQLITGLIFNGPQLVYTINKDLSDMVNKHGFKHVSEAVGSETYKN